MIACGRGSSSDEEYGTPEEDANGLAGDDEMPLAGSPLKKDLAQRPARAFQMHSGHLSSDSDQEEEKKQGGQHDLEVSEEVEPGGAPASPAPEAGQDAPPPPPPPPPPSEAGGRRKKYRKTRTRGSSSVEDDHSDIGPRLIGALAEMAPCKGDGECPTKGCNK